MLSVMCSVALLQLVRLFLLVLSVLVFSAYTRRLCVVTTMHGPIYIRFVDYGLQICPKHVEVDWRNKLSINSASGTEKKGERFVNLQNEKRFKISCIRTE